MRDEYGLTPEDYRVQEARKRVLAMQKKFPRRRDNKLLVVWARLTSCFKPYTDASSDQEKKQ